MKVHRPRHHLNPSICTRVLPAEPRYHTQRCSDTSRKGSKSHRSRGLFTVESIPQLSKICPLHFLSSRTQQTGWHSIRVHYAKDHFILIFHCFLLCISYSKRTESINGLLFLVILIIWTWLKPAERTFDQCVVTKLTVGNEGMFKLLRYYLQQNNVRLSGPNSISFALASPLLFSKFGLTKKLSSW